jgi:hypothetical protein
MKHLEKSSGPRVSLRRTVPAATAVLCAAAVAAGRPAAAVAAPEASPAQRQDLERQFVQLQAELQQLLQENRALREHQQLQDRQLAQLLAAAQPGASALPNGSPPPHSAVPPAAAEAPSAAALPDTSALPGTAAPSMTEPGTTGPGLFGTGLRLWGYGEAYFTDPISDRKQSQFDLARAVFGIGYQFGPGAEFNSEYEVEHAVASASDVGEFEVEQFYVDQRLNDALTARIGLLLMPFGFLNEHHEPTNFYGVQRNFVETLIIPSTWREGGFSLHGETATGFGWSAGLTTGFDLSKWNFVPQFPPYANALALEDSNVAPLQATHQELALANARHLSQYLALSYFGVPGLSFAAAVTTGDAVSVPAAASVPGPGNQRVTLWEAHARWMLQRFDLSALYARGTIGNTGAVNAAHPGSPNPLPAAFDGYYFQGAYELLSRGDYKLYPFARFERYNMGASFEGTPGPVIPSGAVPLSVTPGDYGLWPQNHDRVWTMGANFYMTPHVVLKSDYQWFRENANFKRFDLGLGLAF